MKSQPTTEDTATTNDLSRSAERAASRGQTDLYARLAKVEEIARSNRRELDLQFQRIAQMQAALDRLLKNHA
ncbi:MAG TPA: hypothetical protein VN654_09810 [Vicinamibacterales bacterium]|nr:hypothetical protein [Vicinamibacterales bacterium]